MATLMVKSIKKTDPRADRKKLDNKHLQIIEKEISSRLDRIEDKNYDSMLKDLAIKRVRRLTRVLADPTSYEVFETEDWAGDDLQKVIDIYYVGSNNYYDCVFYLD